MQGNIGREDNQGRYIRKEGKRCAYLYMMTIIFTYLNNGSMIKDFFFKHKGEG